MGHSEARDSLAQASLGLSLAQVESLILASNPDYYPLSSPPPKNFCTQGQNPIPTTRGRGAPASLSGSPTQECHIHPYTRHTAPCTVTRRQAPDPQ